MHFEFEKAYNFTKTEAGKIKPGHLLQDSGGFVYEVTSITNETPKTITFAYRELIFYTSGGVISEKIHKLSKRKSSTLGHVCINTDDIKRVWDYFNRVPSEVAYFRSLC